MPLIFGRSGTQYVAMLTKLLSSNCGTHLLEFSNISDSNWLRYLFSIIFDQTFIERMTSSPGQTAYFKT